MAVVGGVAANSELRAALPEAALAPLALCTDNAAMIASAARYSRPSHTPGTFRSMHMPRRSAVSFSSSRRSRSLLVAAVVGTRTRRQRRPRRAVSWRGLVGEPRAAVPDGQRLDRPAADTVGRPAARKGAVRDRGAGALLDDSGVRGAAAGADDSLRRRASPFAASSATPGCSTASRRRSTRARSRCSTQMPEVVGVYPVRAAFPASVSEPLLSSDAFGPSSGHRAGRRPAGYDGRGVTIALLDTGVDQAHPYLRGRVLPGIDLVDHNDDATARSNPLDPSQVERHGTELAGILVGAGGPGGLHGVAPGATVLPIRIAGWQPSADGRDIVYARSDQLIAGLDRAVDPNGDGDAHDAVRVALVGVAEPYAAFTDSPEARAVQGALDLNTLVVAPAGNDGGAGPSFGSIAGPGGRAGALAVGATDSRSSDPARARRAAPRARCDLRPAAAAARRRCAGACDDAVASRLRARPEGSPVRRAWTSSTGRASASLPAGPSSRPVGADPQGLALAASRAGRRGRDPVRRIAAARRAPRRRGRARTGGRRPDRCGGRVACRRACGHRRRHRSRRGARRHEHHARPGRGLLVARPCVRRQRQAGRRRPGDGARDLGAGHGHRRLAALRLDQRHERRGRDGRRRRRAARADAAGARRARAPQPARRLLAARPCAGARRGHRDLPARRRGGRRGRGAAGDARLRDLGRPAGTRRARSSSGTSRRGGWSSRSAQLPAASRRRCNFKVVPTHLLLARRSRGPRPGVGARQFGAATTGSSPGWCGSPRRAAETLRVPWALAFRGAPRTCSRASR